MGRQRRRFRKGNTDKTGKSEWEPWSSPWRLDFILLSVKGVLSVGSKGPKEPFTVLQQICPIIFNFTNDNRKLAGLQFWGSFLGWQKKKIFPKMPQSHFDSL